MVNSEQTKSRINLANALSSLRLLLVPALLLLAYERNSRWFLICLIISLVTDIADGKIARLLKQTSEFGSKLDSLADFGTYMTIPLCAYWLRPEFVRQEKLFFILVVASYTVPVVFGFAKYRRLTSYHTRAAVYAAYLIGGATILLFANGPVMPFRIAAVAIAVAGLEEIAITLTLPEWRANVRWLGQALRLRRELISK
jgi:CDP-diacylglycerol--glycerol-3-phosphate 3-phosphatidyltransferase